MQIAPPDKALVSAFSDAIERLTCGDGAPLLLAVSGGADSLAMVLLAHAAMPTRIRVATIDHGLRLEAADEALYVAQLCVEMGVAHSILRPSEPITGNIQSSARQARYALLETHADTNGCPWIVTAHHADDQLETILMRIARGSGINGLSAIRLRHGRIIRPLLDFTKSELQSICADAGITPVHDPSNDDKKFERVAMRHWLAGSKHPFDPKRAVRTATAFAEAAEALDWATERAFVEHASSSEDAAIVIPDGLPTELRRRLLLRVLAHVEPQNAARGDAVDRALTDLAKGKRFTLGNVLCEGGKEWRFRPAPARRR